MKYACLLFVILAVLLLPVSNSEGCGKLEKFEECGSACPDDCTNYQDPVRICNKMCVSGCFCKKGYVRAKNGMCILPEECDVYENDF